MAANDGLHKWGRELAESLYRRYVNGGGRVKAKDLTLAMKDELRNYPEELALITEKALHRWCNERMNEFLSNAREHREKLQEESDTAPESVQPRLPIMAEWVGDHIEVEREGTRERKQTLEATHDELASYIGIRQEWEAGYRLSTGDYQRLLTLMERYGFTGSSTVRQFMEAI